MLSNYKGQALSTAPTTAFLFLKREGATIIKSLIA